MGFASNYLTQCVLNFECDDLASTRLLTIFEIKLSSKKTAIQSSKPSNLNAASTFSGGSSNNQSGFKMQTTKVEKSKPKEKAKKDDDADPFSEWE